jgi:cell division septation protein DedD
MSEPVETETPAAPEPPQLPAEVLTLMEAADLYASARAKLPAPGKEFHGPDDAKNFQAYTVALLALERAAMAKAGRSVKQ